jgi:hypothetical protein
MLERTQRLLDIEPEMTNGGSPMLALFAEWDSEDAFDDPEELAWHKEEWDETQRNLAANRVNFPPTADRG